MPDRVITVVARSQRIPRDTISPSSTFDELGIDSLGGLGIAFDLEEEFGIRVPNDTLEHVHTINDLIEGVRALASLPKEPSSSAGG